MNEFTKELSALMTQVLQTLNTTSEQNRAVGSSIATIRSDMSALVKNTAFLNAIHEDTKVMREKLIDMKNDTATNLKISWGLLFLFMGTLVTACIGLASYILKIT